MNLDDMKEYREFLDSQRTELKCLEFTGDAILWHYTTGDALINIIESGELYATQVSCLNDSTEVRYSAGVLLNALRIEREKQSISGEAQSLLGRMVTALTDQPGSPSHGPSPYFVTCFSEKDDDLSQWRAYSGGENGYAIGFRAAGLFGEPNSLLVRVNYNKGEHRLIASRIADATVRFFEAGLRLGRAGTVEKWADEFLAEWGRLIGHFGPMVKDEGFNGEKEFRLIHELQHREMGLVRFHQKKTLMSRYLPIKYPQLVAPRIRLLPIAEVKIGPSRHKELSAVSIRALLAQIGYGNVPVTLSEIPFQQT